MTKAEREQKAIEKLAEMRQHEDELRAKGHELIAGIDEVGRGPLAGPVYAACVVLPEDFNVPGVNDSKKLSAKRREQLSEIIREQATAYGIGVADNKILAKLGSDYVILLDERGKAITSPALAKTLQKPLDNSRSVTLIIGGAYGVDQSVHDRADFVWSLSPLVFPHQLVRLILAEQIYRAQEIAGGRPYHHE